MKSRINQIVVTCLVAFAWSGMTARGGFFDTALDGFRNSNESSSRDSRYRDSDSRYDDDSRYDRGRRDHSRSRSSRGFEGNDPESIVKRAYEDILNREPDQQGMRTYRSHIIDDNWSEQDVRNDLRKSAERAGKTPESADAVITRAYQDILGRNPDSTGLANYRAKLLYQNWSERDVRSDLKKSQEARSSGGVSNDQASQMVRRAYQNVLGREPDPTGNALYVQKITQSRWSENDVANALRNSQEYRQRHKK